MGRDAQNEPALANGAGSERLPAAAEIQFFAETLQSLACMKRYIECLRVRQPVEIRPEEHKSLVGDDLNRFMRSLQILSGQALAEPVQSLPFTEPSQGGASRLPHFQIRIVPGFLKTAR